MIPSYYSSYPNRRGGILFLALLLTICLFSRTGELLGVDDGDWFSSIGGEGSEDASGDTARTNLAEIGSVGGISNSTLSSLEFGERAAGI